jgi:hypothetical protein
LYFGEPSALTASRKPDQLPLFYSYPARPVRATWEATLPETISADLPRQDPAAAAYYALLEEIIEPGRQHRMLGHPQPVKGDTMNLECQLVSSGIYCGNPSAYDDPRAASLRQGAADWILLLQVDSDNTIGWTWRDAGRLYFWIKKPDLAARRFDRVWTILQSC